MEYNVINKRLSRQAIVTKYIPATDHRGSRCKAYCNAGQLSRDWNSLDGNDDQKAAAVAMELASKLKWDGNYTQGSLPSGEYVFVWTEAPANKWPDYAIDRAPYRGKWIDG